MRGDEKETKDILDRPKIRLPFMRPTRLHKDKKKEQRKRQGRKKVDY
jgi:hypothetical protein